MDVKKIGAKPVDMVEMWHTGGPSQGWMLDADEVPHPRIIQVPIEAHFTKTDEKGFSLFEKKGYKSVELAKAAKCPPDVLAFLLQKKAAENELAPTIESKLADEMERRGVKAAKAKDSAAKSSKKKKG